VKVVFGLGNPGRQYEATRHNVGWMVLDRIASRAGWSGRARERDAAASARGRVGDLDLLLVKPLTYMNESGLAVRKVLARERAKMEDVLVVADDFALPFGRLRVRASGTAGGHNGLRSIIAEMGTQDFARLRVGIGEPRRDATDHVLSRFAREEERLLAGLLDAAADAVETWAREGAAAAANRWNAWQLPGLEPLRAPSRPAPARQAAGTVAPGTVAAAPGADTAPGTGPGAVELAPSGARDPGRTPADVQPLAASPGPDGVRRTRTGWRRVLDRLAEPGDDDRRATR
jgi:peptidyl-tRNA hydrolase, PTH1 family